jgi:hypothetical protein
MRLETAIHVPHGPTGFCSKFGAEAALIEARADRRMTPLSSRKDHHS